jgi:hypothetical protein
MTDMTLERRSQFEQWLTVQEELPWINRTTRMPHGDYQWNEVNAMWVAWQAAANSALKAQGGPVAWRIFDGEGAYQYYDGEPTDFNKEWAARYGREHEPLYTAPPTDALRAENARLRQVADAALAVVRWEWSENDDDCVADISRLLDALKAASAIDEENGND